MPTKTCKEEKTILRFTSTENSRLEPGEIQKKDKEIFCCYKHKNNEIFNIEEIKNILSTVREYCLQNKIMQTGIIDDLDSGTNNSFQKQKTERILMQSLYPVKISWITTQSLPLNINKYLRKIHEHPLSIHPGINRMHEQLKSNNMQWPGMKRDIADVVNNCPTCQLTKTNRQNKKIPMVITDTAEKPFQKISLDFIGPLPLTLNGNQHTLTIQDDLTKFLLVKCTPTTETAPVAKTLIEIFSIFGLPRKIRTDQGSSFCSKLIEELTTKLNITHLKCSPYHPESNGALERTHSSIKQPLKIQIDTSRQDWDEYVHITTFAFNTAIHSSIGYSPYEILFGQKPTLPYLLKDESKLTYDQYLGMHTAKLKEVQTKALETQKQKKEFNKKKRYDKKNKAAFNYQIGDKVRLQTRLMGKSKNLTKPYEGPYLVTKVDYPNLTLNLDGKEKSFTPI